MEVWRPGCCFEENYQVDVSEGFSSQNIKDVFEGLTFMLLFEAIDLFSHIQYRSDAEEVMMARWHHGEMSGEVLTLCSSTADVSRENRSHHIQHRHRLSQGVSCRLALPGMG